MKNLITLKKLLGTASLVAVTLLCNKPAEGMEDDQEQSPKVALQLSQSFVTERRVVMYQGDLRRALNDVVLKHERKAVAPQPKEGESFLSFPSFPSESLQNEELMNDVGAAFASFYIKPTSDIFSGGKAHKSKSKGSKSKRANKENLLRGAVSRR